MIKLSITSANINMVKNIMKPIPQKDMSSYRVLVILVTILLLCCSGNCYSWNFDEHKQLGESAFSKACHSLITVFEKDSDPSRTSLLKSVPCSNIDTKARQYGVRAALSGDHVNSPEDFLTEKAERQSLSLFNYGTLALKNHEHFWPHVKQTWRRYHEMALESAQKAHRFWTDNLQTKAISELEKALIYSSFADHFLQDAFSIGHGGFSRINSLQNTSLIFHNEWNKEGRLMKGNNFEVPLENNMEDAIRVATSLIPKLCNEIVEIGELLKEKNKDCNTDIWYAYGDGELGVVESGKNSVNYKKIMKANIYSIAAVIFTFLDGKDRGYSMMADSNFPISTQSFEQQSLYASYYSRNHHGYKIDTPVNNECRNKSGGVYSDYNTCWFDLENSFMEPVYPDLTIGVGRAYLSAYKETLDGYRLVYSPYSPRYLSWWPKNLRVYDLVLFNHSTTNAPQYLQGYSEVGFNITLPNFYNGTPISHEIEIAPNSGYLLQDNRFKQRLHLGFITNYEVMRAKLSLGLGLLLPNSDLYQAEYKGQLSISLDFGVLGGGPISRWNK